jgi:hypothetical protein
MPSSFDRLRKHRGPVPDDHFTVSPYCRVMISAVGALVVVVPSARTGN